MTNAYAVPAKLANINERSFLGSLVKSAEIRGDKPAIRFTDGGTYSAPELLQKTGQLASLLVDLGVRRGDRVAIMCGNRVEFLLAIFACSWLGAVASPLNIALRGMTLSHPLGELAPKVILCEDATLPFLVNVLGPEDGRLLNVDEHSSFKAVVSGEYPGEPPAAHFDDPVDLCFISYTSGTTGPSKGIMYSNEMAITFAESNDWMINFSVEDVAFTCLPLFHGNAVFSTLVPALRAGALIVFAPRFSASNYWNTVRQEKATVLNLLGSMVPILLDQPPTKEDAASSVRIASAVPMPDKRFHEFQQRFDMKLTSLYGMTDMGILTGIPFDVPGRPGKCGIENPIWETFIADDNGMPVPPNTIGELLARPRRPNIMQLGYWKNPEATLKAWKDLWFHTGDYVRKDQDGWHEFIDRKKDAMRRFGENISSFEVESALQSHPAVEEVAVYAVPSEMSEDEVMTSLVIKRGMEITPRELLEHC
ncbi:MAG TPA: AMP-binding protein, partial [Steroidobacteraceae bacterium]|nr:AMP-binding protein [Steroidobacteraceae bacterium]